MKKDGSNIIPFPRSSVEKIEGVEEYDLETTYHIVDIITEELEELGYDLDQKQKRDIGVLANLLFASFQRNHKNNEHIFHYILDECDTMIKAAKEYIDALDNPAEPDNELDDGEPSNDNNRL